MKTKIVIADPFPIVRLGLRNALARYIIAGEAGDGMQGLKLCRQYNPDLLIVDYHLPGRNSIAMSKVLTRECPGTRILVFSYESTEEAAWACLKAGASGYITKAQPLAKLIEAVEDVLAGKNVVIPPLKSSRFMSRDIDRLSERQLEILQLITEGQTTKGCAVALQVSPKTVEFHRGKLMETLNIWDIPGLVRFAVRNGLVSL